MGLLTGEIVKDFTKEGYSAIAVASASAFWVGIYSLVLGVFRLGFLLDFIPLPVLSGYVSGAAIQIILQQLKPLFGEPDAGSDAAGYIRYFFQELPQTEWRTFVIGLASVVMLVAMQALGRGPGRRVPALWYFAIARNALVLAVFTLVSWGVNRGRAEAPLFGISKVTSAGVLPAQRPDAALLVRVAGRSVAVFVAAALEHLAIGRAFGRRCGYEIDQDQELAYIGTVNLVGSFLSCMPVTGGFSRTAVNAESGVKSPLGGVVTSACVLVSIYALTGAFYWIPKATLAAIIVVAVWQIVLPARVFWQYWQTSLADFVGSMVAFWTVLFVDVEVGIAAAVAYSVAYLLLQLAFSRVTLVTSTNVDELYPGNKNSNNDSENDDSNAEGLAARPIALPDDAMVIMLHDAILFPNAARIARRISEQIYTHSLGAAEEAEARDAGVAAAGGGGDSATADGSSSSKSERLWSDSRARLIARLRRSAPRARTLPRIRVVVLDLTRVTHIDTTGMQALADVRAALLDWAGAGAELRFVGLNEELRGRFARAAEAYELEARSGRARDGGGGVVFDVLQTALAPEEEGEEGEGDRGGGKEENLDGVAEGASV